jgi:hypothetical protein
MMDKAYNIWIDFTAEEIDMHTITVNGSLFLKHSEKGKKGKDIEQPEYEKKDNKSKVPYNDNLAQKLTAAYTPTSFFRVRDGFKVNSKVNTTHRIVYIKCLAHECGMPVRYDISKHKKNSPLRMMWHVKCDDCKEIIRKHQIEQITTELGSQHPDLVPQIPPTPQSSFQQVEQAQPDIIQSAIPIQHPSRIDTIFTSLEEVIKIQLDRVKERVLAVAAERDSEPLELLKQNAEAFGANIGKIFTKCIESIETEEEDETETEMNRQLGVKNTQEHPTLSAIALALQQQQQEALNTNNQ